MTQLHRDLVLHNVEGLAQKEMTVEAQRQPNGLFVAQIETSSEALAMSIEILRLVASVASRIYTAIDRAQSEFQSEQLVTDLRKKEKAVAEQYWIYRDQGIAHRKAIEITCEVSDVAQRMGWSRTDVGYCVRNYPREYFKLNHERKEVDCVIR